MCFQTFPKPVINRSFQLAIIFFANRRQMVNKEVIVHCWRNRKILAKDLEKTIQMSKPLQEGVHVKQICAP